MPDAAEVRDFWGVIQSVLDWMVGSFGAWPTALIMIGLVAGAFYWRRQSRAAAETGWREALAEKERSIQRLAKDNREMRIVVFKEKFGWTNEEIDRYLMAAEFDTGKQAREVLEQIAGKPGKNRTTEDG